MRSRLLSLNGGANTCAEVPRSRSLTMDASEPLLLRAARGETVERTPVWMMRQAGRHMAAYRALVSKYPTFRERSEIPEVSLEVSLQPWEAYGVDGVILFSDILTPLPAMGVDFSISEAGGIKISPIRTREAFKTMTDYGPFNPAKEVPFVGEVLGKLREKVAGSGATVLGFVGLPFTLGTYLVEGATGTKNNFANFRALRASDPDLCRDLLQHVAKNIADYAVYQIDSGAQVIQVFDSWAGHLEPDEFAEWAMPYQKYVVSQIKERRPEVTLTTARSPRQAAPAPSAHPPRVETLPPRPLPTTPGPADAARSGARDHLHGARQVLDGREVPRAPRRVWRRCHLSRPHRDALGGARTTRRRRLPFDRTAGQPRP